MAKQFGASTVIERPIEEVFAFLADGENDPRFSPRVQEIERKTEGPIGVGTVYSSTVKDAGMTTQRKFELTEFVSPTRIRWKETSKNLVTAPRGGYDFAAEGDRTKLTFFNELQGHGFGALIAPLALRSARRGADDFANAIKQAVEAA